MAAVWEGSVKEGCKEHPRKLEQMIKYGTAGFRTKADLLDHVMYRMGILAVLRSRLKGGSAIGAMITASHNPAPDNGVKLVEPMGEMLEQSWEGEATKLANCTDEELCSVIQDLVKRQNITVDGPAQVVVGRDTRESSPRLCAALTRGVLALAGAQAVTDLGVVSTPQLHYVTVAINTKGGYGQPSLEGYYDKLCQAFTKFMGLVKTNPASEYVPKILFDGANGVGAQCMQQFRDRLSGVLQVEIVNAGEGELNKDCGADFVKVSQGAPQGLQLGQNLRAVSVDGDADRVVYYFRDSQGVFRLLDGDRIASLVAGHLRTLLKETGIEGELELGCVQTAYANGASTRYLEDVLGVPTACVPTGVKHLHHRAVQFDIGVYFEANGHGTIVFSSKAEQLIRSKGSAKLVTLLDVINQTVGDAISDLLCVECVLADLGWGCEQWLAGYTELPNRLGKVGVRDRGEVTTSDAERKVETPAGMQDRIDQIVSNFKDGRSFVRPSGTEDCVRVYSEAATREEADQLCEQVSKLVTEMLG